MVDNEAQVPAPAGAGDESTPETAAAGVPPQRPRPAATRRNTAMWTVCAAIIVVVAVTVAEGARIGALGLAGVLVGAGVARLVVPGPGLVGIAIRSRSLDAAMYFSLAAAIAVLAQTAPNI